MDRSTLPLSPAATTLQVSFVYPESKEEMWQICGQPGCAHSKALGFFLGLLFYVSRSEEREKRRRDLGISDCHFYFVCARFYVD